MWAAIVKPDAFRLLSGEADLTDYQFGSNSTHHLFCKNCGVKPFGRGYVEEMGGAFYAVNVACLDNISDEELANLPVQYMDGRNDNWFSQPAETRHL
jgi:hypothetical protein